MIAKLTLSLPPAVIELAKAKARSRKTSLSKLVAQLLTQLDETPKKKSLVDEIIRNAPKQKTPYGEEKNILRQRLIEKYGP